MHGLEDTLLLVDDVLAIHGIGVMDRILITTTSEMGSQWAHSPSPPMAS